MFASVHARGVEKNSVVEYDNVVGINSGEMVVPVVPKQ
jgi:hypothetical protein